MDSDFSGHRTNSYLCGPDDIYVSPSQIKRFYLKTGDIGLRSGAATRRIPSVISRCLRVEMINYEDPEECKKKINFDDLVPLFPD